jgi:hypothetical protein
MVTLPCILCTSSALMKINRCNKEKKENCTNCVKPEWHRLPTNDHYHIHTTAMVRWTHQNQPINNSDGQSATLLVILPNTVLENSFILIFCEECIIWEQAVSTRAFHHILTDPHYDGFQYNHNHCFLQICHTHGLRIHFSFKARIESWHCPKIYNLGCFLMNHCSF